MTAKREQPEEYGTGYEESEINDGESSDGEGLDGGTYTQDEEDIEDVAANDITDSQSALSFAGRHYACGLRADWYRRQRVSSQ